MDTVDAQMLFCEFHIQTDTSKNTGSGGQLVVAKQQKMERNNVVVIAENVSKVQKQITE